jgi:hypothetical protein
MAELQDEMEAPYRSITASSNSISTAADSCFILPLLTTDKANSNSLGSRTSSNHLSTFRHNPLDNIYIFILAFFLLHFWPLLAIYQAKLLISFRPPFKRCYKRIAQRTTLPDEAQRHRIFGARFIATRRWWRDVLDRL